MFEDLTDAIVELKIETERLRRERYSAAAYDILRFVPDCDKCWCCAHGESLYQGNGELSDLCRVCQANHYCRWQWRGEPEEKDKPTSQAFYAAADFIRKNCNGDCETCFFYDETKNYTIDGEEMLGCSLSKSGEGYPHDWVLPGDETH